MSRFLDIQQVAAMENGADMANFNMQLHGDLVSLMEECTEGLEIVRNTKTEVGLDAWRRLNHKYDPRNPFETHTVAGEVARAVASSLFRLVGKFHMLAWSGDEWQRCQVAFGIMKEGTGRHGAAQCTNDTRNKTAEAGRQKCEP